MAADPLASLKDIHLPPPIHHWLIAPGWIMLYCLLIILIAFSLYYLSRKYHQNATKREALLLLSDIQKDLQKKSLADTCNAMNNLLKRVALVYYPRREVADLHGQAWLDFLNQTSQGLNFTLFRDFLVTYPYQKLALPSADLLPLFQAVQVWIKQQSTSATEWSATSTHLRSPPHPPDGHLLPVSGEKGKRKKLFNRTRT